MNTEDLEATMNEVQRIKSTLLEMASHLSLSEGSPSGTELARYQDICDQLAPLHYKEAQLGDAPPSAAEREKLLEPASKAFLCLDIPLQQKPDRKQMVASLLEAAIEFGETQ